MMLILVYAYVIIGVIALIVGFLNNFYNLDKIFMLFLGILFLMTIALLVEIFLEIF